MASIQLTKEQAARLAAAEKQTQQALARLGEAHLAHSAIAAQFEKSKVALSRREQDATLALGRQEEIASSVVKELELPPGQWTFNAELGQLAQSEERKS